MSVTVTCVNDAPSFTVGPEPGQRGQPDRRRQPPGRTPSTRGPPASPPARRTRPARRSTSRSPTPSTPRTCSPSRRRCRPTGVLTFTTNPADARHGHHHAADRTTTAAPPTAASTPRRPRRSPSRPSIPPPVAVNDAYTATGNVGINVNTVAEGVLQRGTDDTLFGATITHCGADEHHRGAGVRRRPARPRRRAAATSC